MENNNDKPLMNYLHQHQIKHKQTKYGYIFEQTYEDGYSKTHYITIFPHMSFCYFDIHTKQIPQSSIQQYNLPPLQFNYCIKGRIELLLDDHSYMYLKEHEYCLSIQNCQSDSYFPMDEYQGFTIYFDEAFFKKENPLLQLFSFPLDQLKTTYFLQTDTFISTANDQMKQIFDQLLLQIEQNESSNLLQITILQLFHELFYQKPNTTYETRTFYTKLQVEIAKQAEAMLASDLKQHIPIKTIAEHFKISETSLKNYFKGVYGKNISLYLNDLRMEKAAYLLTTTKQSIGEIALEVGYTKQGKFAEVFRKKYGVNPLSYRRLTSLKKENVKL